MNRSERTVTEKLDVKGKTINQIARWYFNGELFVNRRYQRKLVWTLDEKILFIDSLINKYPTPSIMINHFEEKVNDEWVQKYEIIDGLQRLDAIFSFIKGEFGIKQNNKIFYFDISHIPSAGVLLNDPNWKSHHNLLSKDVCADFADSELPIILSGQDINKIEDIFKRINSTGKKLSKQDLRQAGVTGRFSDLVRITATTIRKDYTEDDTVELSKMSTYSLNSKGLNYGIDIKTVFWIEHGIITEDGIRRSKDEEIIACIYNCILNNYISGMSSKTLDKLYNAESTLYKENENKLTPSKAKDLLNLFTFVFKDLIDVFRINNTTFSKLLFVNDKNYNKDLVFIIIFLSFVQLRNENYVINDFVKIGRMLRNIASTELNEIISISNCGWTVDIRTRLIKRIKNVLIPCMNFKEIEPDWNQEVIELLKRADTEKQIYDFKIGMTDLRTGELNLNVVPKCVKTLTAMANTKPNEEVFIVFGISDKDSDAIDFKNFYKVDPVKYNNYYVTGITEEATKCFGSIQNYIKKIKNLVEKEDVLQSVIFDILTSIDTLKYNNQTLLVMKLKTDKPLFYKKKLYVRYQSDNKLIEPGSDEYYKLMTNFNS